MLILWKLETAMNENIYDKWDEILNTMKTEYEISDISFETWLRPLSVYSVENNKATILAKDKMHMDYIEKKYSKQLMVTVGEITGASYSFNLSARTVLRRKNQRLPRLILPPKRTLLMPTLIPDIPLTPLLSATITVLRTPHH